MAKWVHRLTQVDPETRRGICSNCGEVDLKTVGYNRRKKTGADLYFACGEAVRARQRLYESQNKEAARQRLARKRPQPKYGACPLCGVETKLVWDHDHATGEYRDHLCKKCNCMLGFAKDVPETLIRGALYLMKHSSRS